MNQSNAASDIRERHPSTQRTLPLQPLRSINPPEHRLPAPISAEPWALMNHSNVASDIRERHAPPRYWGGFGDSAPLLTSKSVWLSIYYLHDDITSTELEVWARVVPHDTMQHPALLGRDIWMCICAAHVHHLASPPNRSLMNSPSLLSAPKAFSPSSMTTDQ